MASSLSKVLFFVAIYSIIFGITLLLGILIGSLLCQNEFNSYKETSIITCNYANQMTDVVNNQSNALEKCWNKPELELIRIKHLNCSLLGQS